MTVRVLPSSFPYCSIEGFGDLRSPIAPVTSRLGNGSLRFQTPLAGCRTFLAVIMFNFGSNVPFLFSPSTSENPVESNELSEYRGSSSKKFKCRPTRRCTLPCVFASLIPQVYSVETARLMAQGGCWALSGGDRAARWRTSTVLLREHRVNDGRIRTTESRALKKRRDDAAYEDASTGRDSEFKSSSLK
ncbi:hypothetical protein R3P38DRAFT_2787517 [Favolaschia claudopus]|uniref:Uncharacterized protein n=1 Tax=Favolaschia claudopus TaxID=2862362 RepID=A0AAW0AN45_9AGAR